MKGSPVRSTPEQVVSRRPALLISAAARTERGMKGGGYAPAARDTCQCPQAKEITLKEKQLLFWVFIGHIL